ncbi:MAG: AI-2E family transporter [Oligoflexia bacterium]|nr:AI-2E family transporter [Oligoflexia bacterium]
MASQSTQPKKLQPLEVKVEGLPASRRTTLVVFLGLLLLTLALTFYMVLPYLLAVTMGGILALLAQPAYRFLRRHRFKERSASLLVTLGVLLVVIAPLSLFMTKAVQQGIAVGQKVAEGGFSFRALLEQASRWPFVEAAIGNSEAFEAQARRWIQAGSAKVTGGILALAANVPEVILQIALACISCYFLLVDGNRLRSWAADKIPMDSDVRARVGLSFRDTAISVIWATLAAASAQSLVMLSAYLFLGVPAAFLAGGTTFIFAWIPILGSTPVWVAGAIYLYVKGSVGKAILMLAFGAIAGVVDNFVRPLVLKGRSKMHPLVSLVAIFGGIGIFGIVGVFLGPILAAVLISLLQLWPEVGRRFGVLQERQKTGTVLDSVS